MSSVRLSKATKTLNISLDRAVEELAKNGHDIPNNRNTKISEEQYEVLRTAFADDLERKKAAEEMNQQVKEEKETLRGTKQEEDSADQVIEVEPVKDAPKDEKIERVIEQAAVHEKEKNTDSQEETAPKAIGELKVMGKIDLENTKRHKESNKKDSPLEKKVDKPVVKAPKKSNASSKSEEQVPSNKPLTQLVDESLVDTEHKTEYVKIDGPKFTGQTIELPIDKPQTPKKKRTRIKTQGP